MTLRILHFRPIFVQLDVGRGVEIKCERRAVSLWRLTFRILHFRRILEHSTLVEPSCRDVELLTTRTFELSGSRHLDISTTRLLDVLRPSWIAGRRPTINEKDKRFFEGQSSPQSNALWFASGTPEHWCLWGREFPEPLEKSRGSSRASCISLVYLLFFIF